MIVFECPVCKVQWYATPLSDLARDKRIARTPEDLKSWAEGVFDKHMDECAGAIITKGER